MSNYRVEKEGVNNLQIQEPESLLKNAAKDNQKEGNDAELIHNKNDLMIMQNGKPIRFVSHMARQIRVPNQEEQNIHAEEKKEVQNMLKDPEAIINKKQKHWADKVRIRNSQISSPSLLHKQSLDRGADFGVGLGVGVGVGDEDPSGDNDNNSNSKKKLLISGKKEIRQINQFPV